MKLFDKVAVVGVGLIGGSIALGLRKKGLAAKVVGVSRHAKTLRLAKKRGAIDAGNLDLHIIKDADLIILATPVDSLLALAPKISRIIKKEAIVADVGSTKFKIVSALDKIFPRFVGTHPLAGSEKRGMAYAGADIFQGSLCILTPTSRTERRALAKIRRLWSLLGAKTAVMNPQQHDQILSFASHLPHIAAFSLINSVPEKCLPFSSGGLKDTTRIASSESELWSAIFLSNRKNLLKAIGIWERRIQDIKSAIQQGDRKRLDSILKGAKKKRDTTGW
jgi:prephenate dehydrogenase